LEKTVIVLLLSHVMFAE